MTAQQLKNAILQEAIQGRLVPQDPNDEPASVLLDRIRKEKQQLVKEGKLKKKDLEEKPISEDEIPFEIPESWEWVRLKNLVSVLGDGIHGTPEYDITGKYYFINGNNLSKNKIIIKDNTGKVNDVEYQKYKKELNEKTILVSINGTIGNVGHYNGEPVILGKSACYFNLIDIKLKEYITLLMYTDYFLQYARENATGSTIKNVSLAVMNDFLFPLPPLAEQKRIVAKIEELMPKVEEYGKAQEKLNKLNEELPERLKKSILQEAIEGRLVPQDPNDEPASVLLAKIREEKKQLVKEGKLKKKDLEEKPISEDEIPFEIPDSWEWVRMQSVIEFINGRAYKKDELLDRGKYKVLRVGNLFTNDSWYYSNLELPEDKYCYSGDLLYAWSASFGPHIWDAPKTIFHYHIWNVKYDQRVLYREYLYYFFLIDKMKIKGSTTGSTMVHVSMENMKPRLIPLPPLAEQHRIVEKIEQLFKEIDKLKK